VRLQFGDTVRGRSNSVDLDNKQNLVRDQTLHFDTAGTII